ncbi:MAG: 30S ribosomal protein S16 [Deltaproteobacteria bacterium]|nr:30S ribosomal protein S16 [Deltaproteobacteria bacterium]
MVSIRLARQGTKKRPFYRVVVTDSRSPRGGRFLENIGTFDPSKKSEEKPLNVNAERLAYWRGHGAVLSETLTRLVKTQAKAEAAAPAK